MDLTGGDEERAAGAEAAPEAGAAAAPVHGPNRNPPTSLAAVQLPPLRSFAGVSGRPLKRRMLSKLQPLLEVAGASAKKLSGEHAHTQQHACAQLIAASTQLASAVAFNCRRPCHILPPLLLPASAVAAPAANCFGHCPLPMLPSCLPFHPAAADCERELWEGMGEEEYRYLYSFTFLCSASPRATEAEAGFGTPSLDLFVSLSRHESQWLIQCQSLRAACKKSACCKWLLVTAMAPAAARRR
jgi:hypothetical protein